MPVQHVGGPINRVEDPTLITGSDPDVKDVRRPDAPSLAFASSRASAARGRRRPLRAGLRVMIVA